MPYKVYISWIQIAVLIVTLFFIHPVIAEDEDRQVRLERLNQLNRQVQEQGKRDNYPQVETSMSEMIELMEQLKYPSGQVLDYAHIRIKYSLSVNRFGPAREAAKAWLDKHPDDIIGWELLGDAAVTLSLGLEARKAYQTVYEKYPSDAKRQFQYLRVLNIMNDRDAALPVCEQILKTHKDDPALLKLVIESYLLFDRKQEVAGLINDMKSLTPDDPFIIYAEGKSLFDSGDNLKAIECFKKVPKGSAHWYDANCLCAASLSKERKFKEAVPVFIESLIANPNDTNVLSQLSQCLARLKNKDGAMLLQEIKKIIEKRGLIEGEANYLWRTGEMAHYAMLRSSAEDLKGNYRLGQTGLEEVCKAIPDSYKAKEYLARHHLTTVQACLAEKVFARLLLDATPGQKNLAIANLVEAQLRLDRPEKSLDYYKNTPDDDPLKQTLCSLIGSYYLDIKGNPKQALPYLKEVKDASYAVMSSLARAYLESDDLENSLKTFSQIKDDFDDPFTWMCKVRCLARLGKGEEANSLYQKTIKAHPVLSPLFTIHAQAALAVVNHATDRKEWEERAKKLDEEIASIRSKVMEANRTGWPGSLPILIELSDIYNKIGDKENALRYAQLAFEGDRQRSGLQVKIIQLMDAPEQIFERLNRIDTAKKNKAIQNDFKMEIAESLGYLGLTPQGTPQQ